MGVIFLPRISIILFSIAVDTFLFKCCFSKKSLAFRFSLVSWVCVVRLKNSKRLEMNAPKYTIIDIIAGNILIEVDLSKENYFLVRKWTKRKKHIHTLTHAACTHYQAKLEFGEFIVLLRYTQNNNSNNNNKIGWMRAKEQKTFTMYKFGVVGNSLSTVV